MNTKDAKYAKYALVREMCQTPSVVAGSLNDQAAGAGSMICEAGRVLLTGEGSSRIFPAKSAIAAALRLGLPAHVVTEGATQALEYKLDDYVVFGASNSGQTKEVIRLFDKLAKAGHKKLFGLTANRNTRLESIAARTFVLSCGKEDAVAATKSVVEQALFYRGLIAWLAGDTLGSALKNLAGAIEQALALPIDPAITAAVAKAGVIHFAGSNDGVAEELTLKTNEITRKKSDFLEGTYAVHGIEEVMDADDVVIVVNPFEAECEKFKQVLVDGVGMKVFAIATAPTIFPTIVIPDAGVMGGFVALAAGWNLLVEVGLALGVDLDKPVRARKVGNEFIG